MVFYSNCENCSHKNVCIYKERFYAFLEVMKEETKKGPCLPEFIDRKYCCHHYLLKSECEI